MKILSDNIRFLLLLVLLGTGIISCSEDMEEVNDDVQVTFTATLQDDLLTRSFGEGLSVDKLVIGVFDLNDNGEYVEIAERHYADIVNGKIENVTLSLAKSKTYNFVFWAYNSGCEVYDVTNLTAIRMKNDIANTTFAQMEDSDAFFATVENFTVKGNTNQSVLMKRPLAQINVGTSGKAVKASFTVKNTADTFHPFTKTVSGDAGFTWTFEETTDETFSVDGTPYTYLSMGYIFTPIGEAIKKSCELILTDTNEKTNFPTVETQANHRSNIVGSFTE